MKLQSILGTLMMAVEKSSKETKYNLFLMRRVVMATIKDIFGDDAGGQQTRGSTLVAWIINRINSLEYTIKICR